MNPNDNAYAIGAIFGALLVGAIAGLITLGVGRNRDRPGLGWVGFGLCLVAGFLFGLFGAAPMALVMSLVIMVAGPPARKPKKSVGVPRMRTPTGTPYDL